MEAITKAVIEQFIQLCRDREAELTRYADISDSGTHQMHFDYLAAAYETVGKDLAGMLGNMK